MMSTMMTTTSNRSLVLPAVVCLLFGMCTGYVNFSPTKISKSRLSVSASIPLPFQSNGNYFESNDVMAGIGEMFDSITSGRGGQDTRASVTPVKKPATAAPSTAVKVPPPAVKDGPLGPLTELKMKKKNKITAVDSSFPDDIDAIVRAYEAWRVSTASATGTPIKPFNQVEFDKFKVSYYKIAFEKERGTKAVSREMSSKIKFPTEVEAMKAYEKWRIAASEGKPMKKYDKDEFERFKVSYYKVAVEKARGKNVGPASSITADMSSANAKTFPVANRPVKPMATPMTKKVPTPPAIPPPATSFASTINNNSNFNVNENRNPFGGWSPPPPPNGDDDDDDDDKKSQEQSFHRTMSMTPPSAADPSTYPKKNAVPSPPVAVARLADATVTTSSGFSSQEKVPGSVARVSATTAPPGSTSTFAGTPTAQVSVPGATASVSATTLHPASGPVPAAAAARMATTTRRTTSNSASVPGPTSRVSATTPPPRRVGFDAATGTRTSNHPMPSKILNHHLMRNGNDHHDIHNNNNGRISPESIKGNPNFGNMFSDGILTREFFLRSKKNVISPDIPARHNTPRMMIPTRSTSSMPAAIPSSSSSSSSPGDIKVSPNLPYAVQTTAASANGSSTTSMSLPKRNVPGATTSHGTVPTIPSLLLERKIGPNFFSTNGNDVVGTNNINKYPEDVRLTESKKQDTFTRSGLQENVNVYPDFPFTEPGSSRMIGNNAVPFKYTTTTPRTQTYPKRTGISPQQEGPVKASPNLPYVLPTSGYTQDDDVPGH